VERRRKRKSGKTAVDKTVETTIPKEVAESDESGESEDESEEDSPINPQNK
jgi:hypothetical protein